MIYVNAVGMLLFSLNSILFFFLRRGGGLSPGPPSPAPCEPPAPGRPGPCRPFSASTSFLLAPHQRPIIVAICAFCRLPWQNTESAASYAWLWGGGEGGASRVSSSSPLPPLAPGRQWNPAGQGLALPSSVQPSALWQEVSYRDSGE